MLDSETTGIIGANHPQVLLLSPYHGGSHQNWAEGYRRFSALHVNLLPMPARFWKWRMHGGAITLARRFLSSSSEPDIILATDMLDITTFLALTRSRTAHLPIVLYMHENQLTYPLPADKNTGPMRRQLGERDRHYAFINYASMLAADQIWFNSDFHKQSFLAALPGFLKHLPEFNELGTVQRLHDKSLVIPVGIDLQRLQPPPVLDPSGSDDAPLILWNQRWEYDKNPEDFFAALDHLADQNLPFRVALCGQKFGKEPPVFSDYLARSSAGRVCHTGYADPNTYRQLLWAADITISTAHHEFFGISILEAIYARSFPILPARLSYPELIPSQFHQACLYEDFTGLTDRLKWALNNSVERQRVAADLADAVAKFDWRRLARRYDDQLRRLVI